MQERSKIKQLFLGDIDDYAWWLIGLFLLTMLGPTLNRYWFYVDIKAIVFGAYLLCYWLRFQKKDPSIWNRFKLLVTFMFLLILIDHTYLDPFNDLLIFIGIYSLITLYFIDRVILKAMKKFSIILNVILLLISIFFIVFARIQLSLAQEQTELATEMQYEASRNAEKSATEAANAREAEAWALKVKEELEECKKLNN